MSRRILENHSENEASPFYCRTPQSAYIHIPFCTKKCGYCDFVSFSGVEHHIPIYFAALMNEIKVTFAVQRNLDKGQGVEDSNNKLSDLNYDLPLLQTVYFGGGTPGMVPFRYLCDILHLLRREVGVAENAEITLEVNPGNLATDQLSDLYQAGFNRLSIGLQSAQPQLLKLLGRIHSPEDFLHLTEYAKMVGWQNISGDMMLGLPGQSLADVQHTVEFLDRCQVTHVSLYSLMVEPDTPFWNRYRYGEGLPAPELEREMYHTAVSSLEKRGFELYEISNMAKPGYQSQHNLTYWAGRPYYGFGCGAASFVNGERRSNPHNLKKYIAHYSQGEQSQLLFDVDEIIDLNEAMIEYFMLGFRRLSGVSITEFEKQFGQHPPVFMLTALANLQREGLIYFDGDSAHLSCKGLDYANQVFMAFLP